MDALKGSLERLRQAAQRVPEGLKATDLVLASHASHSEIIQESPNSMGRHVEELFHAVAATATQSMPGVIASLVEQHRAALQPQTPPPQDASPTGDGDDVVETAPLRFAGLSQQSHHQRALLGLKQECQFLYSFPEKVANVVSVRPVVSLPPRLAASSDDVPADKDAATYYPELWAAAGLLPAETITPRDTSAGVEEAALDVQRFVFQIGLQRSTSGDLLRTLCIASILYKLKPTTQDGEQEYQRMWRLLLLFHGAAGDVRGASSGEPGLNWHSVQAVWAAVVRLLAANSGMESSRPPSWAHFEQFVRFLVAVDVTLGRPELQPIGLYGAYDTGALRHTIVAMLRAVIGLASDAQILPLALTVPGRELQRSWVRCYQCAGLDATFDDDAALAVDRLVHVMHNVGGDVWVSLVSRVLINWGGDSTAAAGPDAPAGEGGGAAMRPWKDLLLRLNSKPDAASHKKTAVRRGVPTSSGRLMEPSSVESFVNAARPEAQQALHHAVMSVLRRFPPGTFMHPTFTSTSQHAEASGKWLHHVLQGVTLRMASPYRPIQRLATIVASRFCDMMAEDQQVHRRPEDRPPEDLPTMGGGDFPDCLPQYNAAHPGVGRLTTDMGTIREAATKAFQEGFRTWWARWVPGLPVGAENAPSGSTFAPLDDYDQVGTSGAASKPKAAPLPNIPQRPMTAARWARRMNPERIIHVMCSESDSPDDADDDVAASTGGGGRVGAPDADMLVAPEESARHLRYHAAGQRRNLPAGNAASIAREAGTEKAAPVQSYSLREVLGRLLRPANPAGGDDAGGWRDLQACTLALPSLLRRSIGWTPPSSTASMPQLAPADLGDANCIALYTFALSNTSSPWASNSPDVMTALQASTSLLIALRPRTVGKFAAGTSLFSSLYTTVQRVWILRRVQEATALLSNGGLGAPAEDTPGVPRPRAKKPAREVLIYPPMYAVPPRSAAEGPAAPTTSAIEASQPAAKKAAETASMHAAVERRWGYASLDYIKRQLARERDAVSGRTPGPQENLLAEYAEDLVAALLDRSDRASEEAFSFLRSDEYLGTEFLRTIEGILTVCEHLFTVFHRLASRFAAPFLMHTVKQHPQPVVRLHAWRTLAVMCWIWGRQHRRLVDASKREDAGRSGNVSTVKGPRDILLPSADRGGMGNGGSALGSMGALSELLTVSSRVRDAAAHPSSAADTAALGDIMLVFDEIMAAAQKFGESDPDPRVRTLALEVGGEVARFL